MKRWIHVDFWFRNTGSKYSDKYITSKQQKDFEETIKYLINKLHPKRKFYLWEDTPHCFLALENVDSNRALKIIKKIKREYIRMININTTAGDDSNNGEGFLNILNAFTDWYLFYKDNKLSHIIHCCLEFIAQSRNKENKFYQMMAIVYQSYLAKKNGKIKYLYKNISPCLRKKLKAYLKSLPYEKPKEG